MISSVNTMVGGAILALVGYLATDPLFQGPAPVSLDILEFEYIEKDGMGAFRQVLGNSKGNPISAVWSVQITRMDENGFSREVCKGTGGENAPGLYSGQVDVWALDDWANDDCPDVLRDGDLAEAAWVYENGKGGRITTSIAYTVRK